jgi:hypothetical protein
MPNTNQRDLVRRSREDHTVIANSESEGPLPRPCERSDIAEARIAVFGERMENANGCLTVDGSQFITVGSGQVNFTSSRIPTELLHAGQFFLYGVPLAPARLRLRRPS